VSATFKTKFKIMIRPIYVYGHTVLRKKATDIKKDGSIDVKELAN